MNKIIGIYKITSPSGKVYIGQSIDCNTRRRWYKNLNCKGQVRLYNSIMKHGWDKHTFEVIHRCDTSELNDLEIYYIDLFQSFNTNNGLNMRPGGDSGRVWSDESKNKLSATLREQWSTGKRKDFKWSDDSRRKASISKMGVAPWNKGKKGLQSGTKGGDSSSAKPLVCTKTNEVFASLTQAADHLGIPRTTLSQYMTGKRTNKTTLKFYESL